MHSNGVRQLLCGLCALSVIAACSPGDHRGAGDASTPAAKQDGRVPEAEQRLAAYLEVSLVSAPATHIELDTLMACVPENMSDPIFSLADYRVLSSRQRGDTADATAVVTTVAEETGDMKAADRRVATERVKQDTLHWTMVRDAKGRWGACGRSKEGYDFGSYGTDANTRWQPPGASRKTMLALADSIRRHR